MGCYFEQTDSKKSAQMIDSLRFLKIGLEFVVIISIITALGYKLDQFFLFQPKGIISGMLTGVILGFVHLWRTIR